MCANGYINETFYIIFKCLPLRCLKCDNVIKVWNCIVNYDVDLQANFTDMKEKVVKLMCDRF